MNDFLELITSDYTAVNEMTENIPTLPTVIDNLNPLVVTSMFDSYHAQIDSIVHSASTITVTDSISNQSATETTLSIKNLINAIEKERKRVKEPYLLITKEIDNKVKGLQDRLKNSMEDVNGKIFRFMSEERRKEQERLRIEQEKERERIRKEQEVTRLEQEAARAKYLKENPNIEPPPEPVIEIHSHQLEVSPELAEKTISTNSGTTKLKTVKEWDIISIKNIPDEIIRERFEEIKKAIAPAINSRIKAGILEIAGINIFETTILDTKVRR